MKRIRAEVEITRRISVEFEVDDELDDEEIQRLAIEASELGEWEDAPQRRSHLKFWRSHERLSPLPALHACCRPHGEENP
jgi:hypothetical protein